MCLLSCGWLCVSFVGCLFVIDVGVGSLVRCGGFVDCVRVFGWLLGLFGGFVILVFRLFVWL